MACTTASPGIPVEVFVKQEMVAPVGVGLIQPHVSEDGSASVRVACENSLQPAAQLIRDLAQRPHLTRPSRTLDQKIVAVIHMEFFQRFDEQVVDRKPDWSAPVRVAAEECGA